MKVKTHNKYIFLIINLLSICSMWIGCGDLNLSILEKILFLYMCFIYLFLLSEYIQMIMYRHILINILEFKMYFPCMKFYKIYNIILPIISMIIYILAWALYIGDSEIYYITSLILILMSSSCISYSYFGRKKLVFANKNSIILNYQLISYTIIKTYDLYTEIRMGNIINEITVYLYNGDKITFNVDSKYLDEFIENISE